MPSRQNTKERPQKGTPEQQGLAECLFDHVVSAQNIVGKRMSSSSNQQEPPSSYWNATSDEVYRKLHEASSSSHDNDHDDNEDDEIWKLSTQRHHRHTSSNTVSLESTSNHWDESEAAIDSYWEVNEMRNSYLWKLSS